ncbi:MAG: aldolase [Proteobacteria bacterium]|nr:aldolase [Pseudomonadota bacterium]
MSKQVEKSNLNHILITNKTSEAEIFAKANISRIMVDLEINGKVERQGHLDTVISRHEIKDINPIRRVLDSIDGTESKLLVRINPLNDDSEQEIEKVILAGADYIMLPMFTTSKEVKDIAKIIDNRVKLVLLCEHYKAIDCLNEILDEEISIDEVHLGLNDLRISAGYNFLFSAFTKGYSDKFAQIMHKHNKSFGIGGISAIGFGDLPAEKILTEHARLGSSRVILGRHFKSVIFKEGLTQSQTIENLKEETSKLSDRYNQLLERSNSDIKKDTEELTQIIKLIENI